MSRPLTLTFWPLATTIITTTTISNITTFSNRLTFWDLYPWHTIGDKFLVHVSLKSGTGFISYQTPALIYELCLLCTKAQRSDRLEPRHKLSTLLYFSFTCGTFGGAPLLVLCVWSKTWPRHNAAAAAAAAVVSSTATESLSSPSWSKLRFQFYHNRQSALYTVSEWLVS